MSAPTIVLRGAALLLGAYTVATLLAWRLANGMMYFPPPKRAPASPDLLRLVASDGEPVGALYLPNPSAKFTILSGHGNAEDLDDVRPLLEDLQAAGFSVLGYDYHGYGASGGRPSEAATYRDIEAAYRFLTVDARVPPARILVHGRSIGGGPATWLAAREPVGGLILESTFVSAYRVLTRLPLLPFDKYPNRSRIGRVRCPVFVIHGLRDDIIAPWHGRDLFAAAPEPKRAWWVEGAGHNDLALVAGKNYPRQLAEFARSLD